MVFFGDSLIDTIMGDYRKLLVWKNAKDIAIKIYGLTNQGFLSKDYSLRDQMRRAAISIPSNIAEGEESGFDKLSLKYFHIAKASLAELSTQVQIAFEIGYIENSDYHDIIEMTDKNSRQLANLIRHRQKSINY